MVSIERSNLSAAELLLMSQHPRGVIRRHVVPLAIGALNYFADAAGINDTERDCRRNAIASVNNSRSAARRKMPFSRVATIAL